MVEPVPANASEGDPNPSEDQDSTPRGEERSRRAGRRKAAKKKRSFWKELPILIVVALVLTFLIQQFLGRVYMIPSGSMEQTLHGCPGCTGDRVLVDKVTYAFSDPGPGDVVVFKGPEPWTENDVAPSSSNGVTRFFQSIGSVFGLAPPDERDFVKRIIATGGQTVEASGPDNTVKVDGKPLDEPYIYWEPGTEHRQDAFAPVKVPEGSVWVMGDNRNNSCDSRCQGGGDERGVVPVDNIIGKARFIVLPPSRWGGVSDYNPQEGSQPAAMSAPSWQQGAPAGIGVAAAWPTVVIGRRIGKGAGKVARRGR